MELTPASVRADPASPCAARAVSDVRIPRILSATGVQRAMPRVRFAGCYTYVRFRSLKALPSRLESADLVLAALVIHRPVSTQRMDACSLH